MANLPGLLLFVVLPVFVLEFVGLPVAATLILIVVRVTVDVRVGPGKSDRSARAAGPAKGKRITRRGHQADSAAGFGLSRPGGG